VPVTLDDLHIGLPVPHSKEIEGHKMVCIEASIWLKSDIVDGRPTRWPRVVATYNIGKVEMDREELDKTYLYYLDKLPKLVAADLAQSENQHYFDDNVIASAETGDEQPADTVQV
jgi:hypothetical protein